MRANASSLVVTSHTRVRSDRFSIVARNLAKRESSSRIAQDPSSGISHGLAPTGWDRPDGARCETKHRQDGLQLVSEPDAVWVQILQLVELDGLVEAVTNWPSVEVVRCNARTSRSHSRHRGRTPWSGDSLEDAESLKLTIAREDARIGEPTAILLG